jgi:ubiquinone/menaquinone biosynthesis C-methylase UbiE
MSDERYVPAAGVRFLTPAYDRVIALTMRERTFRPLLTEQVLDGLGDAGRIVDVGCGTGTWAAALAGRHGGLQIVGVDGDPAALKIAAGKRGAAHVSWQLGLAGDLPLAQASADRVVLSLLLHHLSPDDQHRALTEARRVLRPGGSLHVADWGRPSDPAMAIAFTALRVVDGFSNTSVHGRGGLPHLIAAAGFEHVRRHHRLRTGWGVLELLSAQPSHG